ncbi:3'-5' DNA helicase [Aspergillus fumigatus]|nr:3'-5' DNA helicase [Aspergillus fumigatus]
MSVSGDDFDDYFDDEIDDVIVPGTSDTVESVQTNNRPAKQSDISISQGNEEDEFQSPDRLSGNAVQFEDVERTSKYNVFIPKCKNVQENIFVTQLTQPPSPPEMIRGPRWKKPGPEPLAPEPATTRVGANHQSDQYHDEDKEMEAAIAASLRSFEEENGGDVPSTASGSTPARTAAAPCAAPKGTAADVPFDLDDIPDDAFDSDLSLSPPRSTSQATRGPPVQSQFRTNRPLGLRQSTLFDMAARNPDISSQRGEQIFSPPEKSEPPTHHKLNEEALNTWVYPTNLGKTRDYQFNIAQRGLFHNLLVALPTGLGKTFIAATIMLNWYRWTKSAQIIFVAPTKPLVAQQISACFQVAGIPRSETTMLTGEAAPGIRAEEWKSKRVFFMTPQTLVNDLKSGIADPKRIVLLVVDEAHRATGGYAYVEVVKFLKRYNKSFRVLALTATPGSTVESVQAIIDDLGIAKVEIRTEQSLDIREYVHARDTEVQTFQNSDEMVLCMELFTRTLQPLVDQLRNLNAYWGRDPMALTAFGLTKARQQWMGSDAGRNANLALKGKVNAIFTVLASLAHAIDLLKYHGITPFYRHLLHFQSNTDGRKGGKYQRQIVQDESFKKLMNHLQPWTKNPDFIGHPKLEYLKQVVLNHFMNRGEGTAANGDQSQSATRIMIFVHFRDSAEEVVRVLKRHEPLIRPHVFVGQSSAKGSEGMDQKTQLSIVQKFKKGTYNTIVATSIGEEGLDIGEVDLIVCYDSSASPIRMLQRMGRTGRKRAGNIVLLLMQGKEEESYIKAKDNYEKMQQMIASGTRFTFHDDKSPRILPPGVRPVAEKRQIDIPVENTQADLPEPRRRARPPKRPPKKFHMPDDVETGFAKASSLTGKVTKKAETKRAVRKPTPEPVEVPALEEVLLTPRQQQDLERRYCHIAGTSPEFIRNPRVDAYPRLQSVPRPTKAVKHGSLTSRMIGTLQKMGKVSVDCESRYRKVLALDSSKEIVDSVLSRDPWPPAKNSGRLGEKTHAFKRPSATPRPNNVHVREDENEDNCTPELVSPEKLMSSFLEPHTERPLYSSQRSQDAFELDFPDVETLLNRSAERHVSRKRNRFVLDDDSDE